MRQTIILFCLAAAAFLPEAAGGQQRKAAQAAVPPLKEIVKEAFTKELGMGKPRTVRIEAAYKALTESNILELIDSKSRPDTIYLNFTLSDDGELPGASAWRKNGKAYLSMYMRDLSHFNKYIRKYAEKYNLEWYYTNSYFVYPPTKSHDNDKSIIYNWDEQSFKEYEKRYKNVSGLQSDTFLRIIRTRSSYSYDCHTCYYHFGVTY